MCAAFDSMTIIVYTTASTHAAAAAERVDALCLCDDRLIRSSDTHQLTLHPTPALFFFYTLSYYSSSSVDHQFDHVSHYHHQSTFLQSVRPLCNKNKKNKVQPSEKMKTNDAQSLSLCLMTTTTTTAAMVDGPTNDNDRFRHQALTSAGINL